MDPAKYTENRKNWVQAARDVGQNPYPHKFERTHRIDHFREAFESKATENGVFLEDVSVSVTGRIVNIRSQGAKLIFIDLEGDSTRIQVMANANSYAGDKQFEELHVSLRRGDIIGVEGVPGR